MSRIVINSNIPSLVSQRSFNAATRKLTDSFTRLSSGLRINKASDDAAGLAVSSGLQADKKIYSAAVRNANDFISANSIIESSLSEISNILDRVYELATQAQNSTYSNRQRLAMDAEGRALVNEANRIVESTSFNGLYLLRDPQQIGKVALGYGNSEALDTNLGEAFQNTVSDGTISQVISANGPTGQGMTALALGDFNEDGNFDIISGQVLGYQHAINLGNGDGTFRTANYITSGPWSNEYNIVATVYESTDLNRDGNLDLLISGGNLDSISGTWSLLGNGDGTFKLATRLATYTNTIYEVDHVDLNGDGFKDLVGYNTSATNDVETFINNGDGTFRKYSYVAGSLTAGQGSITTADFNNDGFLDLAIADSLQTTGRVALGNGNGSFKSPFSINFSSGAAAAAAYFDSLKAGDLNGDGNDDLALGTAGGSVIGMLGRGDGTFGNSYILKDIDAGIFSIKLQDLNGDNILDVAGSRSFGGVHLLFGNGDGTFRSVSSAAGNGTGQISQVVEVADLNNDDALDFVTNTYPLTTEALKVFISNTEKRSTIETVNLKTISSARDSLASIEKSRRRVLKERVNVGSIESRLGFAINSLEQRTLGIENAVSQIQDADVAEESSRLVASQILQKAASGVLAQANLQPQLALKLLEGI